MSPRSHFAFLLGLPLALLLAACASVLGIDDWDGPAGASSSGEAAAGPSSTSGGGAPGSSSSESDGVGAAGAAGTGGAGGSPMGSGGASTSGSTGGSSSSASSSSVSSSSASSSSASSTGSGPMCSTAADCPPTDECHSIACANGDCVYPPAPDHPLGVQTLGDCQTAFCIGGNVTLQVDDSDTPPADSNACTIESCSGGQPTVENQAGGAACGPNHTCDWDGLCHLCKPLDPCSDSCLDSPETDVDCGGGCAPCSFGQHCNSDGDCLTAFCSGGFCSL